MLSFPSQTVISCWVTPRATAATPSSTARTASVSWRATRGRRWCRRTAAAASCTAPTPASTWPSRWRRLWRAERSTSPRCTSTRRMVGAQAKGEEVHSSCITHISQHKKIKVIKQLTFLIFFPPGWGIIFSLVWSGCDHLFSFFFELTFKFLLLPLLIIKSTSIFREELNIW